MSGVLNTLPMEVVRNVSEKYHPTRSTYLKSNWSRLAAVALLLLYSHSRILVVVPAFNFPALSVAWLQNQADEAQKMHVTQR